MRKNTFLKRIGLAVFALVTTCAMGIAFADKTVTANANTPLVTIVDGGSVRTNEPYGMRFSADYSETLFENGELKDGYEAGFVLAETGTWEGDLVIGTEGSKNVTAMVWDAEKYNRLNAVIVDIPEEDFDTNVTAVAYLKNGDDVTYTTSVVRNVAQVASRAMANGYTSTVLETYINTVNPQITLPTEVVENTVTLLVGQTISYSVSPEYLTAIVVSTTEGVVNVNGTEITAENAGTTDVTIKLSGLEKVFRINVIGGTNGNVSLGNPFVWVMEGSGSQNVQNNVFTSDYNSRNALMFDMDSNGAHVLNNVNNFAIEAEMTVGTAHPNAGGESRGGVFVYAGARWMIAYFYNAGYANQIYYYDGSTGWLTADGGYVIDTISSDVSENVTIRVEKIGGEIRFYANGEYMRAFQEDAWTNAQIGLETKYTQRTVTVKEYKTIDSFSFGYRIASDKNMALKYENDTYTFVESTDGLWEGVLPCFDGGSMHIALLNNTTIRNYTFETTLKLSQVSNASGTFGVIGMWVSGGHKSWLEISKDGVINAWTIDGVGYGTAKALSDFGLTKIDEIPVKVVKAGTSLRYYINGQLAYDCTSQYFDYDARCGVFGISPASNGSNGGQYGAQFKLISLTVN